MRSWLWLRHLVRMAAATLLAWFGAGWALEALGSLRHQQTHIALAFVSFMLAVDVLFDITD